MCCISLKSSIGYDLSASENSPVRLMDTQSLFVHALRRISPV